MEPWKIYTKESQIGLYIPDGSHLIENLRLGGPRFDLPIEVSFPCYWSKSFDTKGSIL